ncbi:TPA: hypothetical protein ACF5GV_002767 [Staphylococcus aureus]|uniref:hypothetical protein n=1 Tax=Staphylococcus TaxID=1279 RepID=UPI0011A9F509|nr:hypothetical protein [Staphylococcus epidermidis]
MMQNSNTQLNDLLMKKSKLTKSKLSLYFEALIFLSLGFYLLTNSLLLYVVSFIAILSNLIYRIAIKRKINQYDQRIINLTNADITNNGKVTKKRAIMSIDIIITIIQLILIIWIFFV